MVDDLSIDAWIIEWVEEQRKKRDWRRQQCPEQTIPVPADFNYVPNFSEYNPVVIPFDVPENRICF